jgi:hypothetical protein
MTVRVPVIDQEFQCYRYMKNGHPTRSRAVGREIAIRLRFYANIMRNLILISIAVALMTLGASGQQSTSSPPTPPTSGAPAANSQQAGAPASAQTSPAAESDSADPLLDVPPLPKSTVTLLGGTVTHIDRVRNRMTVEPFGGKRMKVVFDERTHIYRDGIETTQLGVRKGDRVYIDTQLDGSQVFARNIRVENNSGPADARGQIVSYDSKRNTVVVRDELSTQPITFHVDANTSVRGKGRTLADLAPGSLVSVRFASGSGEGSAAQEINIAARPGETVTFAGKVMHLDMSAGTLAVQNQSDNKTYEVRFDPASVGVDKLTIGSDVVLTTEFDGSAYRARSISINQAKAQ